MKAIRLPAPLLVLGLLLTATGRAEDRPLQPADLSGHGLRTTALEEVLPRGALIHARFNGLLPVIEGLEGIIKAAAPREALPPDAQGLIDSPHPLLTLAGFKLFGAPFEEDQFPERLGFDPRQPATVSLYPGDPRRMFIVSLPMARADALAGLLTGLLQPREVQRTDLGGGAATRIVPGHLAVPELYLVGSETRAYLCGDRALAVALHALPPEERVARDGFVMRVFSDTRDQHVAIVADPRLLKPFGVQLQQFQPAGLAAFRQQRGQFLKQLPAAQRAQMEQQLRAQFGVNSLEQAADYLEILLDVTSRQLLDAVTREWLSFEGVCLTARLDARYPELGLRAYSHQFQPDTAPTAIPLDAVRGALRRVGSDFSVISATGRVPAPQANPGLKRWVAAVREACAQRDLRAAWFDRAATLLAETRQPAPIESLAPWTLTVRAPVDPQPALADAPTLTAYLQSLRWRTTRAVRIVPDADVALLERALADEVAVDNRNRELAVGFNRETAGQEPWFDHANRLHLAPPLDGIHRLVVESAWLTHGGLFGYDQHELVNRRWFLARNLDGALVFQQGGTNTAWLRRLDAAPAAAVLPAVQGLLDRLPEGANAFTLRRSLQHLPAVVDWLAALEERVRADLEAYLAGARALATETSDPATLAARLERLPMPELLYSVNRRAASGEIYLVLPGNLAFPRGRLLPLVQTLLAGYAAGAGEAGGSLAYTRVSPGLWQAGIIQDTGGLTRLVSTLGNAIATRCLQSQEGRRTLQEALHAPGDGDPATFDEILLVNPRWTMLPRPAPKTDARPVTAPPRAADTPAEALDLTPHYNGRLDTPWQTGGVPNNHLANLPAGVQEFGGVRFDVRGVIQLAGRSAAEQLSVRFPQSVPGIVVGRPAARLHFLHACGWASPAGTVVGKYTVHYANGAARDIPVTYGADVRDWWTQAGEDAGTARVAWSGRNLANPDGPAKQLYLTTWENPLPETAIESLDFSSTLSASAPFLIAITIE